MIEPLYKYAYSYKVTVNHTYECAMKAPEGVLVECGVGAGAQIGAMLATGRQVIGFDSFEGIPIAGPHDTEQPGIGPVMNGSGALVSSGVASHSTDKVISNIREAGISTDNLTLVKGWFQYTVPEFRGEIALLRLDGDLYESTRVCLEFLLPQVVRGGIVIIDDYSLAGCRKACDEYGLKGDIVPGSGGVMWFVKK